MNKVILSGLVAAAIVSGGFLIQSAMADDQGHWGPWMGLKNSEARREIIAQKAADAGLSVEEFKGEMKEKAIETKAEILGVSPEDLQQAFEDKRVKEFIAESGIDADQIFANRIEWLRTKMEEKDLSEEEITAKIEFMSERYEDCQVGCAFGHFMGKKKWGHKPCPFQSE